MKWLVVTIGLLGATAALVAWIYLRDRDTANWRPPERSLAYGDTVTARDVMSFPCGGRCSVTVLGNPVPHRWLTRIASPWRARCYEIDVDTFEVSQQSGMTGIHAVGCPIKRH